MAPPVHGTYIDTQLNVDLEFPHVLASNNIIIHFKNISEKFCQNINKKLLSLISLENGWQSLPITGITLLVMICGWFRSRVYDFHTKK